MVTQPVPGLRIFGLYGVNSIGTVSCPADDFAVNMHCRLPLHGIGDMAVNIKRGCRGHMAYGCRERFHIHPVFQCHGRKGVPQIVKAHLFTARPFQDQL